MNNVGNRRGWTRWVRLSAEESRKREQQFNEDRGGQSTYDRLQTIQGTRQDVNTQQPSEHKPVLLDRRDESAFDKWRRDLANGATKFINDFLDMEVNNLKYQVNKQVANEDELEKVQKYIDLVSKKKELESSIQQAFYSGDTQQSQKFANQLVEVDHEIQKTNDYFLTDGKYNDAVFDLMYDIKSGGLLYEASRIYQYVRGSGGIKNSLAKIGKWAMFAYNIQHPELWGNEYGNTLASIGNAVADMWSGIRGDDVKQTTGAIERLSGISESGFQPVANIVGAGTRLLTILQNSTKPGRAVVRGINGIYKTVFNTDNNFIDTPEDIAKKAIRYSDRDDNLVKSAYKGDLVTQEQLDKAKKQIQEKKEALADKFIFEKEAAKAGKVTLFGNTIFTYNPTVDSDWLLEDEEYGDNLSDIWTMPTHTLASTASTVQMLKYQLPNMGLDVLTSYLLKKAAAGGGNATLGFILNGAATSVNVASGLASAAASREKETADEAIGAYEERVLQDAKDKGADFDTVIGAIDQYLQQHYPKLTEDSMDDRLKHGIMLGIKTGDKAWDESLGESRKGLVKLINANNSLALKDYVETLPYMTYTGSIFKNSIKETIFVNRAKSSLLKDGRATTNKALSRLYRTSGMQEKLQRSFLNPEGVIQHNIDRAAGYFMRKDLPKFKKYGLFGRDVATYVINRAPYAIASSITEGIEEGQQELLKERYKRGEYDDYIGSESMFDLVEGLSTLTLANGAVADYFGINYGDIDNGSANIAKVMNIGLGSSLLFSNVRHASTNIPLLDADNANLRSLFKDIRTSSAVANLLADDYERAQDYQHAGLFYEMIKRGASSGKIADRLQLMLNNDKNTKVTQQMVDDSKTMAENVEFMYRQDWLAKMIKEAGYKKYGAEHKQAILEGAVKITDLEKGQQLTQKQGSDIGNVERGVRWDFKNMLDSQKTDEEKKQFFDKNPFLKLMYDNFEKIYKGYYTKQAGINTSKRLYIAKVLNNARRQNLNPTGDKNWADSSTKKLVALGVSEQDAREAVSNAAAGEKISDISKTLADKTFAIKNKQEAFENLASRYFAYLHEIALDRALNLSKNQDKLLHHVRKNTGLDINTNNLRGIISELQRLKDKFTKEHRDAKFDPNSKESAFNEESGYDWIFDGVEQFDEYMDNLMSWYINGALIKPMRSVAAPYKFGSVNASRVKLATTNNEGKFELDYITDEQDEINIRLNSKYAKLSKEQKQEADDAIKRYINIHGDILELRNDLEKLGISEGEADLIAKLSTMPSADPMQHIAEYFTKSPKQRKADKKRLSSLNEEAAKKFILNRLKESEGRSRVARRVFIDEAMSNAGIEHTDDDVEQLAKDQEGAIDPKVAADRGEQRVVSEQELAVRRKYNHETQRQQKRKEENKEKVAKQKQEEKEKKIEEEPEESKDDEESPSAESPVESSGSTEAPSLKPVEDDEDVDVSPEDDDEIGEDDEIEDDGLEDEFEDDEDFYDTTYDDVEENLEEDLRQRDEEERQIVEDVQNRWLDIEDPMLLDLDENGNVLYDGKRIPYEQAQYIREQFLLLDGIDRQWLDQNSIPNGSMSDVEAMRNVNSEFIGNWLANTFFYATDEEERNESIADKNSPDTFNGVKLPKAIGTADELSRRLLKQNWLYDLYSKGKVYYIVTNNKRVVSVEKGADKRDAYTVSLVIEDKDKCFMTFLRDLGRTKYLNEETGKVEKRNSELWWRNWLTAKNVNVQKISDELGKQLSEDSTERSGQIIKFFADKVKEHVRSVYVNRFGTDVGFESYYSGDAVPFNDTEFFKDGAALKNLARTVIHGRYSINGGDILSETQVQGQINKLRDLRNEIIKLYTNGSNEIPTAIRTDVIPDRLLQSNGKIDTQKNIAGLPTYRPVPLGNVSIDEIEKDFQDGNVVFAYGKGFAAYGNKYAVQNVKASPSTNDGIFHGRGLSGKIYMMVKGLTRDAERVPVMLAEEKFNTQTRTRNGEKQTRFVSEQSGPVAVLDVVNGVVENVSSVQEDGYEYAPSAAEVIFYMLCRRGQFANVTAGVNQKSVLDFIVNNGERTLFESRSGWEKRAKRNSELFNTLTSKQLAWFKDDTDSYGLSIGIAEVDPETNRRVYRLRRFREEDLFAPDGTVDQQVLDQCRQNRQLCINAIAQQMHWNTDQPTLIDFFSGEKLGFSQLKDDINRQVKPRSEFGSNEEYLAQTYSILGCPELSFTLKDILSTSTDFTNLSWLIKNGKLKTDASPQIFKDPYVFGIGAKKKGTAVKEKTEKKEVKREETSFAEIKTPVVTNDLDFFTEDLFGLLSEDTGGEYVAHNKEQRDKLVEAWNKQYSKSNKYTILDRIAVVRNAVYTRDFNDEFETDEDLDNFVKDITNNTIEAWKKSHPEYKIVGVENSLDLDNLVDVVQNDKTVVVQFDTVDGKNAKATILSYDFTEQKINKATFISGVYKSVSSRSGGKLGTNPDKARKWLFDKLGIRGYNVWVQKAAINGANGKKAYGATKLACDSLTHGLVAKFFLSSMPGSYGVEYHEAWHYVNLLLHDEQYRQLIYDEYAKYHKEAENATDDEIEEMLADDFMSYALAMEDKSIKGKVKRFFQNIMDFINLVLNRKQYRQIYKTIQSGGYKSFEQMDDQSVKDFQNKYGGVAYSKSDELKSLQANYEYKDVYEAVDSIVNQILVENRVYGADKLKQLFNDKDFFEKTFSPTVDSMIGQASIQRIDADMIQLLDDLKENKDLIKAHLAHKLQQLGFNVSFKNQVPTDIEEKESNPENTWDKIDISTSRKDSASSKIKMFFSTIPAKELIVDNRGNFRFIDVRTKFGTNRLFTYDEVWGVVVGRLYNVQSYSELRQKVKELSKEHRVFAALEERIKLLDDRNDSELKSQLFGICNSHVNHVQTIVVTNPFEREWEEEFDYSDLDDEQQGTGSFTNEILDVTKEWTLSDDGAYNPGFTLPRNWSQSLASTSFVHYDQNTKALSISEDFVYTKSNNKNGIYDMVNSMDLLISKDKKEIKNRLGSDDETMDNEYKKRAMKLQGRFIALCKVMCIPIDNAVLYHMFSQLKDDSDTSKRTAQKYYDFVVSLVQDTTRGSVRSVVQNIKTAYDNNQDYVSVEGKKKAFDELYNKLTLTSQIGRLAINYAQVYPKLGEVSTRNANGDKIYPVNMNNFVSDRVTDANKNPIKFAEEIESSPYNGHSIIAQELRHVVTGNSESELRLNTFVGIRQKGGKRGNDYLQMTPIEDYLTKLFLTENDNLVFPTMADKKTWYSLSMGTSSLATKKKIGSKSGFALSHATIVNHIPDGIINKIARDLYDQTEQGKKDKSTDVIRKEHINRFKNDPKNKNTILRLAEEAVKNNPNVNYRHFDSATLSRFRGYILDEIAALKHFYSISRIQSYLNNPSLGIDNYDSDIEHGKMLFGGNGGLFRYFYNIKDPSVAQQKGGNLNDQLKALYEIERRILESQLHDNAAKEGDQFQNIPVSVIPKNHARQVGDNKFEYDGFELIREYLDGLERRVNSFNFDSAINDWLISRVDEELRLLSKQDAAINLVEERNGRYYPKGIPTHLLEPYMDQLREKGFAGDGSFYKVGEEEADMGAVSALYSLIGNHVANTMTSIIEIEKVFSGDPAFYSYKYKGKSRKIKYTHVFEGEVSGTVEFEMKDLTDPYSDKIKRLGGLLSPGTNLRLDFDQQFNRHTKSGVQTTSEIDIDFKTTQKYFSDDAEINGHAILGTSKYTIVDANDIKCPSTQIKTIQDELKRQIVIDLIHTGVVKYSGSIQDLYYNQDKFDAFYESIKENKIGEQTIFEYVDQEVEVSSSAYNDITVADAQVMIRPALYRKIRMGLGDWTREDERAYWLLETDDEWMEDPDKAKAVRKFQQYVLKMSYFDNDYSRSPIYNKMAIFPIFKFQRSTDTGEQIYNRMNLAGNEIDMIAFKSAIKVGATKEGLQIIDKNASSENATSQLSDLLKNESNKSIDYSNGEVLPNTNKNTIAVRVQDLKNLRLQLNTHAHEDMVRSIGTQMFKIGFSNIFDELPYGKSGRTGAEIRKHIMSCINRLTNLGADEIREQFYTTDSAGNFTVDEDAVRDYMIQIIHNNGLGAIAEDILEQGGVVSGLQSRKVFEQSISKKVNKSVVDINTLGGTAVQQSCFGYEAYENVISDEYVSYNGGKKLVWHKEDGSMEVLLSIKFFKSAVPAAFRTNYKTFRQYLINHDLINGVKKSIPTFTYAGKEYDDINPDWDKGEVRSEPKPFGIGYRIPTQGMSSTFVFTVADVLPEQVGDLIMVPREFTAQTGSDFDIDKLYLATLSYKDGELEVYDENEPSKNAISNELLLDYMDIISDKKNFFQSRGSIDTFTDILKSKLLPLLRPQQSGYYNGGFQLLPSFQSYRKMEFATGKTGIGPYALNVTNLALTQAARLTIDFGKDRFKLGNLYDIYGKDNKMISGWLSAMVNAHVDVAKDAYVFDLNVNRTTYNMCNFLIRTGNGLASFAFIAQPIIKMYAQQKNAKGGVYGKSLDLGSEDPHDYGVAAKLKRYYLDKMKEQLPLSKNGKLNAQAQAIISQIEGGKTFSDEFMKDELKITWSSVISLEKNVESLEKLKKGGPESLLNHYIHQLLSMAAFERLDGYAQAMSSMVTASQIDTKKFGNDITQHRVWMNNHNLQKYEANVAWKIDKEDFAEPLDEDGNVDLDARSAAAMEYYFNTLFLENKLNKAVSLTREIAKHQLLNATDVFDNVFTKVMQQIYGKKEFFDKSSGSAHPRYVGEGWDKVYDKDKPNQIANALDNICRFYALFNLGEQTDGEEVDLTFGKSIADLINKVSELYFGSNDKLSIFQRAANLIANLNAVHDKEGLKPYKGLVTINGEITNDLLNYLSPMTQSQNHELGRFLLRDSSFDTGQDIKNDLRTAWESLINHPNEEVSELAKDLVIYAYYSKYDQNTPGSFFDIVPIAYRKQYDSALSKVMTILNSEGMSDEEKGQILFANDAGIHTIMDIMYRNYWYDDDIVKSYNYHDDEFDESKNVNIFNNKTGETVSGGWYYDQEAKQSFPGMVISNKVDLLYFKLQKNNVSYLYKKVATISRISRDKTKKNGKDMYVYAVTPKAGHVDKNNTQFEFYADRFADSIFPKNMLPANFAEDELKKSLEQRLSVYNKYNGSKYTLVMQWDTIPQSRTRQNTSSYFQTTDSDSYFNGKSMKSTKVVFVNAVPKSGQKAADLIFNIVLDPNGKYNSMVVNDKYKDKSVDVQFGKSLSKETIEAIKEIISHDDEQVDRKITVHFVTSLYDSDFYRSEQLPSEIKSQINDRIREIIEENIRLYRQQLLEDKTSPETIETLLKLRREEFEEGKQQYYYARSQAASDVVGKYMQNMMADLISSGIGVERLTTVVAGAGNYHAKDHIFLSIGASKVANYSPFDLQNTVYCQESISKIDRKTYSTLIGRLGRIANQDQITEDESIQRPAVTQNTSAVDQAFKEIESSTTSASEDFTQAEQLEINEEAKKSDEEQHKNCTNDNMSAFNNNKSIDDDDFE